MKVELLKMVISTLDCIEVKGRDNLDKLLGCINALETVVLSVETQSTSNEEGEHG